MTSSNFTYKAMLLIGPTGAGKTPLGELLAQRGLPPKLRCVHFDFGENLRRVASLPSSDGMVTQTDIDFIRQVLETGALLEDRDFPIAERILRDFLQRERADRETIVVLNGLPRHRGQAEAIKPILDVRFVTILRCDPQTVMQRIQANTGGDRTDRADDDMAAVKNKLRIFAERTEPLEQYYREQNTAVVDLRVSAEMTPEKMWEELSSRFG